MYYKCVKFHKNPIRHLGGVALTRYRVIPIYPPNFVCRGYNNNMSIKLDYFGKKITNVALVIADPFSKTFWAGVPPLSYQNYCKKTYMSMILKI